MHSIFRRLTRAARHWNKSILSLADYRGRYHFDILPPYLPTYLPTPIPIPIPIRTPVDPFIIDFPAVGGHVLLPLDSARNSMREKRSGRSNPTTTFTCYRNLVKGYRVLSSALKSRGKYELARGISN
jgi:hypothetical protein